MVARSVRCIAMCGIFLIDARSALWGRPLPDGRAAPTGEAVITMPGGEGSSCAIMSRGFRCTDLDPISRSTDCVPVRSGSFACGLWRTATVRTPGTTDRPQDRVEGRDLLDLYCLLTI